MIKFFKYQINIYGLFTLIVGSSDDKKGIIGEPLGEFNK